MWGPARSRFSLATQGVVKHVGSFIAVGQQRVALASRRGLLTLLAVSQIGVRAEAPQETYLDFDSGDFVDIDDSDALDLTTGTFTIEAWIRPTTWGQNNQGRIVDHGGGSSGVDAGWTFSDREQGFVGQSDGPACPDQQRQRLQQSVGCRRREPQRVAARRRDVRQRHDDHVRGRCLPWRSDRCAGASCSFGARSGSAFALRTTNRGFEGSIDEVRIWDRVLTQTEISDGMLVELTGSETGLVAYYRFNAGGGQTAADDGPQGHHGSLGPTVLSDSSDPTWMFLVPPGNTAPSADAGFDQIIVHSDRHREPRRHDQRRRASVGDADLDLEPGERAGSDGLREPLVGRHDGDVSGCGDLRPAINGG